MEKNESTTKEILKFYFETGKKPTEAQFSEFLDSYWHKKESIPKEKIEGLENLSLDFDLLWSPTSKKLSLTDAQGNVLSEISLQSLDNEGTDLRYNTATASLELYNADNELLDSIPVSDFVNNVGTQLALNSNILQLKDGKGNVLSNVMFAVSNIGGLQTVLDTKAEKNVAVNTVSPLQGGGNLSSDRTLSISQSNTNTSGYLSNTDWNTFNNKFDKPSMGANYLGRWNGSTFINSLLQDNGTSSGIGSNNYNNIIWSVDSSSKAALIAPRMTQAQRLAISLGTIQAGAVVYQTDGTAGYYLWNGSSWGTLGSNIATADLTNTQARTFTQNADFTWNTLGNAYFLKGLTDQTGNLTQYGKVLRIDPTTKQIAIGDSLEVAITIPDNLTVNSQTTNVNYTVNHVYPDPITPLPKNLIDLKNFMATIRNNRYIQLKDSDFVIQKVDTLNRASVFNGILSFNNVSQPDNYAPQVSINSNIVMPSDKNWILTVSSNISPHVQYWKGGQLGFARTSTSDGIQQPEIGVLKGDDDAYGFQGYDMYANKNNSTKATIIYVKVGDVLSITIAYTDGTIYTANTDALTFLGDYRFVICQGHMWNIDQLPSFSNIRYYIES